MKLHTFLAIMTVMVLVGCSNNDNEDALPSRTGQSAITFVSNVSGMATRASIANDDIVKTSDGIGIFATYSKHKDASSFNFMQNFELVYNSDNSTESRWHYMPLRYWPSTSEEYLSFTAYYPFQNQYELYSKTADGMTMNGEDSVYIKFDIPANKKKMVDILHTDASTLANMQYYTTDGGETYVKTGTAFTDDNRVLLTMKHATARIAIDVSSSALADPLGDYYKDKTTFAVTDGIYEYTTKRITLNKVVLLGDDTSGEGSSPKGVFYPAGYLNLGITTDDKPLWVPDESGDKIAITYTNTSSSVETVRGKGNFLLGPSSDWQPFTTTDTNIDAPNIKGNQIVGWRTSVTPNGDGTYSAEGNVTEIGSAADGYLFIVPQDFSNGNSSGNKLYLYVDYTVNDTQQNTSTSIKGYVQLHENFEAGKAYVICIDLGLGGEIVQHTIVNHTEDEASSLFVDP